MTAQAWSNEKSSCAALAWSKDTYMHTRAHAHTHTHIFTCRPHRRHPSLLPATAATSHTLHYCTCEVARSTQLLETATLRPAANSDSTARNALLYTQPSKRKAKIETFKTTAGGLEPLHVSMPRELKSCPSTSPTHPGCIYKIVGVLLTMNLSCTLGMLLHTFVGFRSKRMRCGIIGPTNLYIRPG